MNSLFRSFMHFVTMVPIANSNSLIIPEYLTNFSVEEAKSNWNAKFWTAMKASACFWPFVHFLCYQFIPPHLRQLTSDTGAFFYSVFISYLSNLRLKNDEKKLERSGEIEIAGKEK